VAKNISKKELKQPDQFVSFWTRFSTRAGKALSERKKPTLIGVGVLAGVVTATLIYGELSERAAIRSSQALDHVEKIAIAELLPTDGTAPKDDGVPRFKSERERAEGALRELDRFITAEPHSPLHREAQLQKASLLLDLQRPEDAIPIYTDVLGSRLDRNLRFLAQEGLGYAYEAKGDLDQALAAFTRLGGAGEGRAEAGKAEGTGPAPFYRDRALYHQGRIAERKGNPNDAVKLYKEVLEKTPQSSLRDEISNRLAVLEPK
jgi:tetratricopeptide (TPR) repeat protein